MHSGGIAKTLEFIFGEPVEFTGDFTYDSVNITSGQAKPPFEEFMKIYDKLTPSYELRIERNQKLTETDWTQVGDITLENGDEWVAYRQALRDLPSLETPVWPEPPQVKIVEGVDLIIRVKRLEDVLQTVQTELKADLSETKTELKADISETKTNLQTTKEDLQTTLTELAETKTDLEEKTYQIISLEARMAALEQKNIGTN
jgi:hypothetical protein